MRNILLATIVLIGTALVLSFNNNVATDEANVEGKANVFLDSKLVMQATNESLLPAMRAMEMPERQSFLQAQDGEEVVVSVGKELDVPSSRDVGIFFLKEEAFSEIESIGEEISVAYIDPKEDYNTVVQSIGEPLDVDSINAVTEVVVAQSVGLPIDIKSLDMTASQKPPISIGEYEPVDESQL